jgi:hypothetical protein
MLPPKASDKPQLYGLLGGSVNEVRNVHAAQIGTKSPHCGFSTKQIRKTYWRMWGLFFVWTVRNRDSASRSCSERNQYRLRHVEWCSAAGKRYTADARRGRLNRTLKADGKL